MPEQHMAKVRQVVAEMHRTLEVRLPPAAPPSGDADMKGVQ